MMVSWLIDGLKWPNGGGVRLGHLIEARGKQVEGRDDAAVGPEAVLLHHLLVVDGVSDV